ncbi:MAG: NADH-quinone oxidoreductase subunit NuoF, partial [Armatimonadota bacterium]
MSAGFLFENINVPNLADIDVALEHGAYRAWERALKQMTPEDVIEVVSASNLRGRGGAYFPTGRKWSLTIKDGGPNYLCCNADESEPGSFSNRELMEKDPHGLLEGCAIAAYANAAEHTYIYIRGEYGLAADILDGAIMQAYERGYLGDDVLGTGKSMHIVVHRGAGAYICGEETGLLSSLDGMRGQPRLKPPFPGQKGIVDRPSVVQNVETLCNVPYIINNGAEWFKRFGTERCPGTKIFSVSGHVNRPGNYERPMGARLRAIIEEDAGGVAGGKQVKAVIPGGASAAPLTADDLDISMDPETLAAAGSMLGSAGVIVIDEDTCLIRVLRRTTWFFADESCGQCTPCREGCRWMWQILDRVERGQGERGDTDLLLDICDGIAARTFCLLGDSATYP